MTTAEKPLAGIRVLDLATFVAAPLSAAILGEFGAEVIKVEQPGTGDPLRRFGTKANGVEETYCWLSEARNKKSLTLDLRKEEGAKILRALVAKSDVVCENFRPGRLEAWSLGWEDLRRVNPALVMLRISGFGQTGPLASRPGFARIAHAFGGLTHLTGEKDGPPLTPGSTSLADYVSGVYGALGVLLALRARDRNGIGQYIDLALYEPILRILDDMIPTFAATGTVRGRQGRGTSNACPHGHFATSDGWVAIACTNDRMFARLAKAMARDDLAAPETYGTTAARLTDAGMIDGLVQDWTATMTTDALVAFCDENDVPCAAINSAADIAADPHIAARDNLVSLRHDRAGDVLVPGVIPRLSETPGAIETLGPDLGTATAEILGALLGYAAERLDQLKTEGVI